MMPRGWTVGNTRKPRLVQVIWVAKSVDVTNKLDDRGGAISLKDVPSGHLAVAESFASEEQRFRTISHATFYYQYLGTRSS